MTPTQPAAAPRLRRILLSTIIFVLMVTGASAEQFQKGDEITLTRKEPLLFRGQRFRDAEEGETFSVFAHQTEAKRLFILLKDQDGKDIAVSFSEDAAAVVSRVSDKLKARAIAAARAGNWRKRRF